MASQTNDPDDVRKLLEHAKRAAEQSEAEQLLAAEEVGLPGPEGPIPKRKRRTESRIFFPLRLTATTKCATSVTNCDEP